VCAEKAVQESKAAKRYFVSGTVQGVGYRYFAQRIARRLGVAGFVRNLNDGRVEVYAVGTANRLTELKTELSRGPSGGSVSGVVEEDAAIEQRFADAFSIEHDN
jgi:acylphosphatase